MEDQDLFVPMVLQNTAMGTASDTAFLSASNDNPVKAVDQPDIIKSGYDIIEDQLVHQLSKSYESLLSYGSFLDMEVTHIVNQERGINSNGKAAWEQIYQKVQRIQDSLTFRANRLAVLNDKSGENRQSLINSIKAQLDIPASVSWDTVAFKVAPQGFEYLCMQNPEVLARLSETDMTVLQKAQESLERRIRDIISIENAKIDFTENPNLEQYSMLVESRMMGHNDWTRRLAIQSKGDMDLIKYTIGNAQAFAQGIIPGTIQPAKITACQDVITMTELQGSITKLAEEQVWQISKTMSNPNVRAGIQSLGVGGNPQWTQAQSSSIATAASITQQLIAGTQSMGESYYAPQKDLGNYITGGANTLQQQFQLVTQGDVVNLTPLDQEILKQSLSLLLACLRIRADASSMTRGELIAQEDLDHLSIIERLAQYTDPNSLNFFTEMCTYLNETISNGRNPMKFGDKTPSSDLIQKAVNIAIAEVELIVKAVPLFDADIQEGRVVFAQFLDCAFLALADKDRRQREIRERVLRRRAFTSQRTVDNSIQQIQ